MNIDFTLPDDAPFSAEQRQWLKAFIEGKLAENQRAQEADAPGVTVLWGTQTGNSENLARKMGKALKKVGYAPRVVDLADYDVAALAGEENVLIIASTYGDGDPPDNAVDFHSWILSDQAPNLGQLKYSVLALGDTDYPDFCKCGIEFDERLSALGAQKITDRVDCDVDFDDGFSAWKTAVIESLGSLAVSDEVSDEDESSGFSKSRPFAAPVLESRNLNGQESAKETSHVALSLEGSGLEYEAGDALGVYPLNPASQVDELLEALPFNTNEEVPLTDGKECLLRDALIHHYDIRKLTKPLLVEWQKRSGSPMLRAIMESGDKKAIDEFIWGRELIDLVLDYPADFTDGEEFVSVLKRMQPRLYSIASSPKAHPGEVHLTVGVVRYQSHFRQRGGVCSTYLADLGKNETPGVFVHVSKSFRLPEALETDVIMVGPGTGIAPFRAFLEEREATGAGGRNWLFFGDQHASCDFLYQDELEGMQERKVLDRLDTAFSRDQEEKIYVQTRMQQQGAELWAWLQGGAHFYVCGDASRMAKDVDQMLHRIAVEHGGLSESESEEYIKQLRKDKRYARDVY